MLTRFTRLMRTRLDAFDFIAYLATSAIASFAVTYVALQGWWAIAELALGMCIGSFVGFCFGKIVHHFPSAREMVKRQLNNRQK